MAPTKTIEQPKPLVKPKAADVSGRLKDVVFERRQLHAVADEVLRKIADGKNPDGDERFVLAQAGFDSVPKVDRGVSLVRERLRFCRLSGTAEQFEGAKSKLDAARRAQSEKSPELHDVIAKANAELHRLQADVTAADAMVVGMANARSGILNLLPEHLRHRREAELAECRNEYADIGAIRVRCEMLAQLSRYFWSTNKTEIVHHAEAVTRDADGRGVPSPLPCRTHEIETPYGRAPQTVVTEADWLQYQAVCREELPALAAELARQARELAAAQVAVDEAIIAEVLAQAT